jgi:hypothetical protein
MHETVRRIRRSLFPSSDSVGDLAVRVGALELAIGYLVDPAAFTGSKDVCAGHFNGQQSRTRLFDAVLEAFACESIIETGTYLGNTTKYMANASSLPVYSCESNPAFFAIANRELAQSSSIELFFGDSRLFLKNLISQGVHRRRSFFYLDAHWNQDLPLMTEIEIIVRNWDEFVLMVDDFQVPHDDGYGFDDYGPGKRFTLQEFEPAFQRNGLVCFFPTAASAQETGQRRGCVVLTKRGKLGSLLSEVVSLTEHG